MPDPKIRIASFWNDAPLRVSVIIALANSNDPLYCGHIPSGKIRLPRLFAMYGPEVPLEAMFSVKNWCVQIQNETFQGEASNINIDLLDYLTDLKFTEPVYLKLETHVLGSDGKGRLVTTLYFTPLEITNKLLKQIIYETVFFGVFPFTIIFAIRIWLNRNLKNLVKFISSICIIISPFLIHEALPGFGIVNVFWHSRSVWEDLEIIAYKSEGDKILKQRIDSGALGYDKRIVREIKIRSFLSWSVDYYGKDLKHLEEKGWIIKSDRNYLIGG